MSGPPRTLLTPQKKVTGFLAKGVGGWQLGRVVEVGREARHIQSTKTR